VPYTLSFGVLHDYGTQDEGISVPVSLTNGDQSVDFIARVDTGSTFCVFKRAYAEMLGIDV
jgi:hypothetical protein